LARVGGATKSWLEHLSSDLQHLYTVLLHANRSVVPFF
jgi:hypothetical protein